MSGTPGETAGAAVPETARSFLVEHGLVAGGETPVWTPLTGGVSSELWRVDLADRTICVKGALERLKVEGDWRAPVSRNTVEWDWLTFAATVVPGRAPEPLAHDEARGLFAMSYLPARDHPVWKARLLDGAVQQDEAAEVGSLIGRLHAASAGDRDLARRFATDGNFASLRIDPYLMATAARHPDLSGEFERIVRRTTTTRLAVVHGDVSPKNILIGPSGPVLLDAECAWYGDPAFDLAFVVNHLVLKTLVVPGRREALTASARALVDAYVRHVTWEPAGSALDRAAALLPALLLARVDGLSPVEYLDAGRQGAVRAVARKLLLGARPSALPTVIASAIDMLGSAPK
ncbi:phosphotransferase family protein [Actinomadura napierensis]|uniref:Aminoglycoside phosphotransferase family protein n=1 Tax=Actinomadura napierensis TaxID=267854 RepID=A0ABP5LA20_9ACTN